jgi:hypothetical protein
LWVRAFFAQQVGIDDLPMVLLSFYCRHPNCRVWHSFLS